jgi:hypothetical protein
MFGDLASGNVEGGGGLSRFCGGRDQHTGGGEDESAS